MSITRKPNGRYEARFHAPGGKHPQKTFDRKKDADIWLAECKRAIRLNNFVDNRGGKRKLAEVYSEYFATKYDLAPKSIDSIESLWNYHLAPALGKHSIESITFNVVQKWALAAVSGPTAYTSSIRIEKAIKQLSVILDFAVDNQYLPRNPLRKSNGKVHVIVSTKADKKRAKRYLTPSELELLASHCRRHAPLVLLGGICGPRWSELVGLRVADFNFETKSLTISTALTEVNGKFTRKPTKTGQSRHIKLPDFLNKILAAHCAGKAKTELVFSNNKGKPLSGQNFGRDYLEPAILVSGIERITPKDLRDTAASIAISSGANVLAVSNMLGHSDPSVTLRIYAHLFNDDQEILANAIGEKFDKSA
jgi:integrase